MFSSISLSFPIQCPVEEISRSVKIVFQSLFMDICNFILPFLEHIRYALSDWLVAHIFHLLALIGWKEMHKLALIGWKNASVIRSLLWTFSEGVAVPLSKRGRKWIIMAGCMKMINCFALARFIFIIFLLVILPQTSHQMRGKEWCPDAPAQRCMQICGYFNRMSLPRLTHLSCRVSAHFITPCKISSSDVLDVFIVHSYESRRF